MATALVVGSTRGIGKALAERLLEKQYSVIRTSRTSAETEETEHGVIPGVNMEYPHNAAQVILSALNGRQIDILIVSAGIREDTRLESNFDAEMMLRQLFINSIAPAVLAGELAKEDALRQGNGKVIFISSRCDLLCKECAVSSH